MHLLRHGLAHIIRITSMIVYVCAVPLYVHKNCSEESVPEIR